MSYSQAWFDTFLRTIDPAQTKREAAFVARQVPHPEFQHLLDICCGPGRHAHALARLGYRVTGFDVDAGEMARAVVDAGARETFLVHDLRRIGELPGTLDAAILLWQSFGQFDEATNAAVLGQVAEKLRLGGRFILDIYHRKFFESHQGSRAHDRGGRVISEHKQMSGNRLTVRLDYGNGTADVFEWQLFTPEEIAALAESSGFRLVLSCTEFDESLQPSPDRPRVQYVFEKS